MHDSDKGSKSLLVPKPALDRYEIIQTTQLCSDFDTQHSANTYVIEDDLFAPLTFMLAHQRSQ